MSRPERTTRRGANQRISFLDSIERIAEPGYLPSTGTQACWAGAGAAHSCFAEDILHVRLQTLGVVEHSFDLDIGGVRFNWLLYDVGGAVGVVAPSSANTAL